MNTATKNLEDDHEIILRLIDVVMAMVMEKSTDITAFEKCVYLIRNFADRLHHAKEENYLFPMMVRKGFSLQQGPVAVMLNEHTQGRNFVREMSEGIEEFKNGNSSSAEKIYRNAIDYCNLLKNHISKENNILFRMADNAFLESEQKDLLIEFEKIEKSQDSEELKADCLATIEKLESVYH
jgi:hemerythrin-like domain-containing protein